MALPAAWKWDHSIPNLHGDLFYIRFYHLNNFVFFIDYYIIKCISHFLLGRASVSNKSSLRHPLILSFDILNFLPYIDDNRGNSSKNLSLQPIR